MTLFFVVFFVMALVVAAMAVGVMISGREIKGSCGGMNNFEGGECEVCGATSRCEQPEQLRS